MTLIMRNPKSNLPELFRDWDVMDRLWNRVMTPATERDGWRFGDMGDFRPAVDLIALEGEIMLKAELPGVEKDDVEVSVHEDSVTLKGSKRQEKSETHEGQSYLERQYGQFTRTFRLPADVDAGKVTAEFKDGVLEVHLPLAESAQPKKVDISFN